MKKILIILLFVIVGQGPIDVIAQESNSEKPTNCYIAPYNELVNKGKANHYLLIVSNSKYNVWLMIPVGSKQNDNIELPLKYADLIKPTNLAFVFDDSLSLAKDNPLMIFVNKARYIDKNNENYYPVCVLNNFTDIYDLEKIENHFIKLALVAINLMEYPVK